MDGVVALGTLLFDESAAGMNNGRTIASATEPPTATKATCGRRSLSKLGESHALNSGQFPRTSHGPLFLHVRLSLPRAEADKDGLFPGGGVFRTRLG